MTLWLYQLSQRIWTPANYRLDVWEGERWTWNFGRRMGTESPAAGDRIVFYYSRSGGPDWGFFGWAVILEFVEHDKLIYFRPVAPSDQLKMNPWNGTLAEGLANKIRGTVKQGTLWPVPAELIDPLLSGIARWTTTYAQQASQPDAE